MALYQVLWQTKQSQDTQEDNIATKSQTFRPNRTKKKEDKRCKMQNTKHQYKSMQIKGIKSLKGKCHIKTNKYKEKNKGKKKTTSHKRK